MNYSNKVRFTAYDTNVNAFPDGIDYSDKLPVVMFFPAYNKGKPYRKFTGQIDTFNILKFIEIRGDRKIDYGMSDNDLQNYITAASN